MFRVSSSYVDNGKTHKVSLRQSDIQNLLQFSVDVTDKVRLYESGVLSSRVCLDDIYHLIYALRASLKETVYNEHE